MNKISSGDIYRHIDGISETFGIRAAVAFDHKTIEAEKQGTVRRARIKLTAQRLERPLRKKISDARQKRRVERTA